MPESSLREYARLETAERPEKMGTGTASCRASPHFFRPLAAARLARSAVRRETKVARDEAVIAGIIADAGMEFYKKTAS